jgi:hypothetical protein
MGGWMRAGRSGSRHWWSHSGVLVLLLGLVVSGCAERLPAPLPSANGRAVVLGPEPEFNPAALPQDWFVAPPRAADGFKVVDLSGTSVLRVEAPGGSLLGRRVATPLLATPYLHAGWYLDPALYAGGPRDGLPRGLRLIVAFKGGTSAGAQLVDRIFGGDLPPHDRFLEVRLGGIGVTRPDDALLELAVVSDRGVRRVLRGPDYGEAGRWHIEAVDLAALYGSYWPRDRIGQVEIAFVAVGGLQHHPAPPPSGSATAAPSGYVAEILLTR